MLEIGPPLSNMATINPSICNLWALVMLRVPENVCPFTVELVNSNDLLALVAISRLKVLCSCLICASAALSHDNAQ